MTRAAARKQGTTQTVAKMLVDQWIFAVTLDFVIALDDSCPTCFNGGPRFLAIAVRPTGGGSFTPITERQPITSTPYAVKSMNARMPTLRRTQPNSVALRQAEHSRKALVLALMDNANVRSQSLKDLDIFNSSILLAIDHFG